MINFANHRISQKCANLVDVDGREHVLHNGLHQLEVPFVLSGKPVQNDQGRMFEEFFIDKGPLLRGKDVAGQAIFFD